MLERFVYFEEEDLCINTEHIVTFRIHRYADGNPIRIAFHMVNGKTYEVKNRADIQNFMDHVMRV